MTDLQLLFAVLALLYLWECACWVPHGSVSFRSWLGRHWAILHPGSLLGNQKGGFVFAPPLPPLGTVYSGTHIPFKASICRLVLTAQAGVGAPGRRSQQTSYVWEDIKAIKASGKKLRVNEQLALRTGFEGLARFYSKELEAIRAAKKGERAEKIKRLVSCSLDVSGIKERIAMFEPHRRKLRRACNALFLYIFVLAPLTVWEYGLSPLWPALLALLLLGTTITSILFRRAHKALFPEADDERFTSFLLVLLSPVTAIRAADLVSRPLLSSYHPLGIVAALGTRDQLQTYGRLIWKELQYPALRKSEGSSETAPETEMEGNWRAMVNSEVERLLKRSKIDPTELVKAPARMDASAVAYCPRCNAQYTSTTATCQDCGGLKLVPFQSGNNVAT